MSFFRPGLPDAPALSIRSTSDPRTFELRWTRPSDQSESVIIGYKVYTRLVDENGVTGDWVLITTVSGGVLSYTITLKAGKKYEIVVTARNDAGETKKEDSEVKTVEVPAGEC